MITTSCPIAPVDKFQTGQQFKYKKLDYTGNRERHKNFVYNLDSGKGLKIKHKIQKAVKERLINNMTEKVLKKFSMEKKHFFTQKNKTLFFLIYNKFIQINKISQNQPLKMLWDHRYTKYAWNTISF